MRNVVSLPPLEMGAGQVGRTTDLPRTMRQNLGRKGREKAPVCECGGRGAGEKEERLRKSGKRFRAETADLAYREGQQSADALGLRLGQLASRKSI
jgi:hypothetical protein